MITTLPPFAPLLFSTSIFAQQTPGLIESLNKITNLNVEKRNKIISELKNKIYKPIYFLSGDESYFIDLITKYINDNVLTEAEKSFNQTVLYGKETEIHTVINAAKRFPMMANHQVVIVKEAQNIKKIDDLIHYANSPLKSTILVINYKYKTLDKRKKLYKALNENCVLFESKKLYDNFLLLSKISSDGSDSSLFQ